MQYDGSGPCYWGPLGQASHTAEMVATTEVLWFLCEHHSDPRLQELLDKYDYQVTISFDNAIGTETASGEWSGKSEPGLELWLWRLWEIMKDLGISVRTRWQKATQIGT